MLLFIEDHKTIGDLQDKFNECYPYLHIRFYRRTGSSTKALTEEADIDPGTFLKDARKRHDTGSLQLMSWYTVQQVEADFWNLFGLLVQVFRKGKNGWLLAAHPERYTLRDQEELSRVSTLPVARTMRWDMAE